MEKKEIKKIVTREFEKFTKLDPQGNGKVIVYAHKREAFLRILRIAFPDLRLRTSLKLANIDDFTEFVYSAQEEKKEYLPKVLQAIETATGKKMDADETFFPDKDHSSMEFFFDISKVHRAVVPLFKYEASYVAMKNCQTPRELCELLYRRGQF